MADRDLVSSNNVVADYTQAGQVSLQITSDNSRGAVGQALISNGPNSLPSFQNLSAGGGAAGGAVDFQRFNASGTWTKPTDTAFGVNSYYLVRVWGAGGGGGQDSVDGGSGGGGGGYSERWGLLSELGASESVTIGGGGAGGTGNGASGGNSSFGSFITAFGGGGGNGRIAGSANTAGGGGGGFFGGAFSAGNGAPNIVSNVTGPRFFGQGGDPATTGVADPVEGIWHGGGGAGVTSGDVEAPGGASLYGGGGGCSVDGTAQAGGVIVNGGNGGASAAGANAGNGVQPGGGGGGCDGAFNAGNGGDGRVDVIVWGVA